MIARLLPIVILATSALAGCRNPASQEWFGLRSGSGGGDDRPVADGAHGERSAADRLADRLLDREDETLPAAGVARMDSASTIDEALRKGHDALRRNRLQEAKQFYRQVLREQPGHPTAHHRLAIIADKEGDFQTAEHHYHVAWRRLSGDADLLSDMGYSCFLQKRYRESEQWLQAALQVEPRHERALKNLGLLYGTQGHFERAWQAFRRAGGEAEAQRLMAHFFPEGSPSSGRSMTIARNESVGVRNPMTSEYSRALSPEAGDYAALHGLSPHSEPTGPPQAAALQAPDPYLYADAGAVTPAGGYAAEPPYEIDQSLNQSPPPERNLANREQRDMTSGAAGLPHYANRRTPRSYGPAMVRSDAPLTAIPDHRAPLWPLEHQPAGDPGEPAAPAASQPWPPTERVSPAALSAPRDGGVRHAAQHVPEVPYAERTADRLDAWRRAALTMGHNTLPGGLFPIIEDAGAADGPSHRRSTAPLHRTDRPSHQHGPADASTAPDQPAVRLGEPEAW